MQKENDQEKNTNSSQEKSRTKQSKHLFDKHLVRNQPIKQ